MAAALHERFVAIDLNMTAWLGALYNIYGKNRAAEAENNSKNQ